MAKKTSRTEKSENVVLTAKDKKTIASLLDMATDVIESAEKKRPPHMDIPSRSLSNVKYNRSKGVLEMGNATNRRELFNLSQAKSYMQMLLVGQGCKDLIHAGKTLSLRGLFYKMLGEVEGTTEKKFEDQSESDTIIEDVEVTLDSLREEMHLYASNRGNLVGPITLNDNGDELDCTRMGSAGYSIPSIVEPDVIQFKKCSAKFILHVEKDTIFRRFHEDKFWQKHNCLVTHGSGQPPRGVRRLLHRMHNELKLPVYCLLDNDPWGYYIYSVLKQGSINLAFESQRMGIPDAKYIGLRSKDFERCQLSKSVKLSLSEQDVKRAKQIAGYPWFEKKKDWQKEIDLMLKNGFKLEVESLISKDISYVTEVYVPDRLKDGDFLD
ncbi:DNA topoisomerase IV subunit A [Anatilimnocola floriformis]|uniref:DNA topoisomerase IV subunit A n=1 Tax=Anatilimnocola floriformis TaxID=2948575 RepID=UPI0020C3E375|nr:DNA topoisomerase IV subunit A [Anatilimnocola floriformis]